MPATSLVSLYQGGQFSLDSDSARVSADGRWVAFVVQYAHRDVFLYDRGTGDTIYVTEGANGDSANPTISADGRYLAFETAASNLVANDEDSWTDVVVYDRLNATFTRATVASDGTPANHGGSDPSISADGRYVAFASESRNLNARDVTALSDVYVRDLVAGTTVLASSTDDGFPGDGPSYDPSISADGLHVAFTSHAALISDDTIDCQGDTFVEFVESCPDVYVKDLTTGAVERASGDPGTGDGVSSSSSLAPDGAAVAFSSTSSDLVEGDLNAVEDVFVRDMVSGTTVRISVATDAAEADGASMDPAFSPDGRFVAFTSAATNLVAGDRNDAADVFVHDRDAATTVRVSVDSTGWEGEGTSDGVAIAAGGLSAFSSTNPYLVSDDWNFATADVFVHLADDREPTRTIYMGPEQGIAGIDMPVSASLMNALSSVALADEFVRFELSRDGNTISAAWARTDKSGIAATTITLPGGVGAFRIVASYEGRADRQPSSSIREFGLARHATSLAYVGANEGVPGDYAYAAARLTDDRGRPVPGMTVVLALRDDDDTLAYGTATTGKDGVAWSYLRLDVPAGEYALRAEFDGDDCHEPGSDSRSFTVRRNRTHVAYTGANAGIRGETLQASATLTDAGSGAALPGQAIVFSVEDGAYALDYVTATTDSTGLARASMVLRWPPGQYTLEARFAGAVALEESGDHVAFSVSLRDTTTTCSAPSEIVRGEPAIVQAHLARADGDVAIADETVDFELLAGEEHVAGVSATTDQGGVARIDWRDDVPVGQYRLRASFAGSNSDAPSACETSVHVALSSTGTTYRGASNGFVGEPARFAARLVDTQGVALAGKEIVFKIVEGGEVLQSVAGTTDAGGLLEIEETLTAPAGAHDIETAFAGDGVHAPSIARAPFTVRAYGTMVRYVGPTEAAMDDQVELRGRLSRKSDGRPVGGEQLVFSLTQPGVVRASVSAETDDDGIARATLPVGVPAGDYAIETAFAGRLAYGSSSTAVGFDVTRRKTTTSYVGAAEGTNGEPVTLRATLQRADPGSAIGGRAIVFEIRDHNAVVQSTQATTAASGMGSATLNVQAPAGHYRVVAKFAGDEFFASSEDRVDFEVAARVTTLAASAPPWTYRGDRVTLSGTLSDAANGSRLPGRTVEFSVGSYHGKAVTDDDGRATVEATLDQEPATYTLRVRFTGDGERAASEDSTSVEIRSAN